MVLSPPQHGIAAGQQQAERRHAAPGNPGRCRTACDGKGVATVILALTCLGVILLLVDDGRVILAYFDPGIVLLLIVDLGVVLLVPPP